MIWVDREAKKLKSRALPLEWVDDMKTPSGRIHVGSLRGVIVHDLIYKAMKEIGMNTHFSYVINDHDPMDGMPHYLDEKEWNKYMGMPLYKIPAPEVGYENFAQTYAKEFIHVFESINCHPQIIWSSQLYASGKMDAIVKEILDNSDKIRNLYLRVSKATKKNDWFPYTPVCEKCGKLSTTQAYKWDGTFVYYRCAVDAVKWTKGCGYEGKIKPIGNNGKLPWRLDWPATWKVIGVTVEGAGKDHMSMGGSYDFASAVCKEILQYNPPHPLPYEWFTIGGKKMSSSKGVGSSAKEVAGILPPEVFRFLIVRTPIGTHLDFNPFGDTILNLFDDYDKCINAYFDKIENKISSGKQGEVMLDFARIFELSQVTTPPKKRVFIPRFRTIANIIKIKGNPQEHIQKQLNRKLTEEEQKILDERITYAKIYLESYTQNDSHTSQIINQNIDFSEQQTKFIKTLSQTISQVKSQNREEIQNIFFTTIKQINIKPKDAFTAFYQKVIGSASGPKVADLIIELSIPKIVALLQTNQNSSNNNISTTKSIPDLNNKALFSIDPEVKKLYPSISIGFAIIKNVNIQKQNNKLNEVIKQFIQSQQHLTNELIGSLPEVLSYRKLYKNMGIDWHSRRPSPEALLRRISQKKDLYHVNTCVDAYNLVVMNRKVSVGAFDSDQIHFPTILKFPKNTDHILLLGDDKPTTYTPDELAYFDANGGYNIDFNYRDAQRTMVTEKTTNILINVDGIFEIKRSMVEQTLHETINIIMTYCGGIVEKMGIVE